MEGWNITEEHAGTQHHETQRGKGGGGGERGGFVCWRGGGMQGISSDLKANPPLVVVLPERLVLTHEYFMLLMLKSHHL